MSFGPAAQTRTLRAHALAIHAAAVRAVDPERAVERHLALRDGVLQLSGGSRVALGRRTVLFGAGKAAVPMGRAVHRILGPHLDGGLLITKTGHGENVGAIEVWEAAHPVPDAAGARAAQTLLRRARALGPDDLAVVVLSGGASALLPAPTPGLELDQLAQLTEALLRAGAPITELNLVRRRLSRIGGGGLARQIAPARMITLILSDVLGDPLETIGSGPTIPDPATPDQARAVLKRYGLHHALPAIPRAPDPPTPTGPVQLVGSLQMALDGAAREARRLGWPVRLHSSTWTGEARLLGEQFARTLRDLEGPCCLLAGGEPTVTVTGSGKGGRAQELCLAAAPHLAGTDRVLLSAGTDGTDGPTDAAGALVDGETLARIHPDPVRARARLDAHLARNDAYPLLRAIGDLVITGPTQTNVGDLSVGLAPAPPARGTG